MCHKERFFILLFVVLGTAATKKVPCSFDDGIHAMPVISQCDAPSRLYEIPLPYTTEQSVAIARYLNRETDDPPLKYEEGHLYHDDYLRLPLDSHIQGPLLDEIAAEFKRVNPGLRVRLYAHYDDCNLCNMPSEHNVWMCHAMSCPDRWWTFLFLGRRRDTHERLLPPNLHPELIFDWTETEMRERWRKSLKRERFPFPDETEEGDRPPWFYAAGG